MRIILLENFKMIWDRRQCKNWAIPDNHKIMDVLDEFRNVLLVIYLAVAAASFQATAADNGSGYLIVIEKPAPHHPLDRELIQEFIFQKGHLKVQDNSETVVT